VSRRRLRGPHGQAAVELALALSMVAVAMLLIGQLLLVAHDHLQAEHAARRAVRAASVSAEPTASANDAAGASLGPRSHSVAVEADAVMVTVTVTLSQMPRLPIVGPLLRDHQASATAVMLFEPP
jgi:hypothetical protein